MFTKNKIFYTNFSKNRNFNDSSEDLTFEEQPADAYIVPEEWSFRGFWPKSSINWNKRGFRTGVIDRVFPRFLKEIEKELRSGKNSEIDNFRSVDDSFFGEYPHISRSFSDIENLVDENLKGVKTWKSGFVGRKFKPTLIPSDDGFGLMGLRKSVGDDGEERIEGYFYPGFMANMSPEWRTHLESVYGKDYVSDLEKSYAEDVAKTYLEKRNQVPFSPNSPKIDTIYYKDAYNTFERRNKYNQKFLDRQKAIDELKDNPNLVYNPEWRKRADYVLSDDETYDELFSNEEVYNRAMYMNGDSEDWEKFSRSVLSARASKLKQDQNEPVATNTQSKQQEKPTITTNFPIPFHKQTVDNEGVSLKKTTETQSQGGIENAETETKNVAVNNSFTTNFPRKILTTNFSKSKKDKKKRLEELLMERNIGEVGEGYGSKNPYLADVLAVGVAPAIANKIVSTKKELSKYDKLAENDAIVSQSAKSAGLLGLIGAGVGAVGGGIVGWKNNPNINDAMFGAQIGAMGVGGLGALLGGVHGALKGKEIAKKRRDEEKRLILKALEE